MGISPSNILSFTRTSRTAGSNSHPGSSPSRELCCKPTVLRDVGPALGVRPVKLLKPRSRCSR